MVHYMTMIMVNIHEAKAKLSEYLEAVAGGQRVLICKRNQPVAELRAVAAARTEPRPVGGAKGRLVDARRVLRAACPPTSWPRSRGQVRDAPTWRAGTAKAADRPDAGYGAARPRGRRRRS